MDETNQNVGWIRTLSEMPDDRFERLCWRLVTLVGICTGAFVMAIFIGMIGIGAYLWVSALWSITPS